MNRLNTNTAINWDQFSMLMGETTDPQDEELTELYNMFVNDTEAQLSSLVQDQLPDDLASVGKDAHRMRGAAASFGFEGFTEILNKIETEIESLSKEDVSSLLSSSFESFKSSREIISSRYSYLA
ncbi:MAG: Hpt domain-containing protein [Opitutaceae bacterium]|nr:Hpt domain-containing protein [Opitutaceae bacterium]